MSLGLKVFKHPKTYKPKFRSRFTAPVEQELAKKKKKKL